MTYHIFIDLSRGEKLYTNGGKNYIQIPRKTIYKSPEKLYTNRAQKIGDKVNGRKGLRGWSKNLQAL